MRRYLHRLSAVVLAALLSAVAVVPTPTNAATARPDAASTPIACPTDPNIRWINQVIYRYGIQYINISGTPTFFSSDGRTVENGLDQTISATFKAERSRTTTITVSAGTTDQLTEKLQVTLDSSIVSARTTTIGITVAVDVPPHTRTTGLYGVHGYTVNYDYLVIQKKVKNNTCFLVGDPVHATTNAPTVVEGWQFSSVPI
jgi:hypothetical protein